MPVDEKKASIYDYEVNPRYIGKGGFATVYRATHKDTGIEYAIKKVRINIYYTLKSDLDINIFNSVVIRKVVKLSKNNQTALHIFLTFENNNNKKK